MNGRSQPGEVLVLGANGKTDPSFKTLCSPTGKRLGWRGIAGEGRQVVVRSHGRKVLFDYGKEFEFYSKFQ